jgi:hypothetical protein
MKLKFIFTAIILLLFLVSCAPEGGNGINNSDNNQNFEQAQLFAKSGDGIDVYKFIDGTRTCYFMDGERSNVPGGIWCTN